MLKFTSLPSPNVSVSVSPLTVAPMHTFLLLYALVRLVLRVCLIASAMIFVASCRLLASVIFATSGVFTLSLYVIAVMVSSISPPNSSIITRHFCPSFRSSSVSPVAAARLKASTLIVTIGSACLSSISFAQAVSAAFVVMLWSVSTRLAMPYRSTFLSINALSMCRSSLPTG